MDRGLRPDLAALKIAEAARPHRRRLRWLFVTAAVLGAAALGSLGLSTLKTRARVVDVTTVRAAAPEPAAAVLNASGYVTARRRATIAAKITGLVSDVLVDEGMRVEMGQVLATLDELDARARLASATADRNATAAAIEDLRVNLANAQRELWRAEELWKRGLISEQARDQAGMAVESLRARIALAGEQVSAAEARIRIARQDLENCTIRAPFAGVVVSRDAQRGEMVSPVSAGGGFTRTGLATIVDMESLEVEVDVNEAHIARVTPGQAVTVALDAYPERPLPGRVRTVIPTADRQKATVKVRVTFDRLEPRILPDMGVRVAFLQEEPTRAAAGEPQVLVPRTAVRNEDGRPVVYVYRAGRVERRSVRLGQARGQQHEVVAGLSDGEQVVTAVSEALRDGQDARVRR